MKLRFIVLLLFLLLTGGIVRLWRISEPLADWHSWRQVDTAGVTRRYLQSGIDLLRPRYMDLSAIPSGKENPEGWRMVEFPFINGLVAFLVNGLGGLEGVGELDGLLTIERLTSVVFSLGSMVFLFLLAQRLIGTRVAFLATGVFAFLPFNIFYSRVVLPEPKLVFFSLLSSLGFVKFFSSGSGKWWIVGALAGSLATLLKPTWLLIYGPALVYASWKYPIWRASIQSFITWTAASAAVVGLPFLFWRQWISQFPEGIPSYQWLLNSGGIRFRPAWFRWLFADRLGRLILGYWGLIPFGLGIVSQRRKDEGWFFGFWMAGSLLYLSVFASGNVTHDYYQTILIPVIAVFVAKGLNWFFTVPQGISLMATRALLVFSCFMMLFMSWYYMRDFFNINRPEIIEAGRAVDSLTPQNAKVIAPYGADTAFLYQTNRNGWPIGGNIDQRIQQGATHYVSVNFDDETKQLMEACNVVQKTQTYVIIDVRQCSNEAMKQ